MNRRGFLQLIGMAAPALVLDPERLLWVPGQKTFFLPSPTIEVVQTVGSTHGGNTFLTIDIITREALRILESNLQIVGKINRQYDSEFNLRYDKARRTIVRAPRWRELV